MPMIKRLKKELKLLKELTDSDETIYVYPLDITSVAPTEYLAMIIGPEGTPYEGGFFYFYLTLPESFPMEPPKIKYLTQGNKVRFNPNLYVNGKVCLSVIGTWAGPGWSPANTIVSVLQIIQGMVLNDNPLKNEPGFETAPSYKLNGYNEIIRYETYRTALLHQIHSVPFSVNIEVFCYFTDITRHYFIKNINTYYDNMCKLSKLHDGKTYSLSYQNQSVTPNYYSLIQSLFHIKDEIKIKNPEMDFSHIIVASPTMDKSQVTLPLLPPGIKNKSAISQKNKLATLQQMAQQLGIEIKKQGVKGPINKTKAELLSEIINL